MVYTISRIDASQDPPLYFLKSLQGIAYRKPVYATQIKKTVAPVDGAYFRVERILQTRTNSEGKKEIFVKVSEKAACAP